MGAARGIGQGISEVVRDYFATRGGRVGIV